MAAIHKALELEPGNAEAHMRLALYFSWTDRMTEARESAERALALGPNNSWVLSMMGSFAQEKGNFDVSLNYARRAVEADPLHLQSLTNLSNRLILTGRLAEAETYALKMMDIAPSSTLSMDMLARVRLLQGRGDEVLALADEMPAEPTPFRAGLASLWYKAAGAYTAGDLALADASLEEYTLRFSQKNPMEIAMIHAWRGETNEAFAWIDQAISAEYSHVEAELSSPFLKSLHDDPRWAELLAIYDD